MKFIVLEMQTNTDGTVAMLNYQFDTRNEAESKYHYILSYAAVSTLPCYAAAILTNTGEIIQSEFYQHIEPSPEPEPEPEEA